MTSNRESNSHRRDLLKKVGMSAVSLPLVAGAATRGSAEENTYSHNSFEIVAADHIEIDYQFEAVGPVNGITHPTHRRGAEPSNDSITHIGGNRYQVDGRTGFGWNDTWEADYVYKVTIKDASNSPQG